MDAIDLFAGLGGSSEGARMAGVNVVWAANHCDEVKKALETSSYRAGVEACIAGIRALKSQPAQQDADKADTPQVEPESFGGRYHD